MKVIKERTRLIFTEYTDDEKKKIDDLVGTMDKVFSYEDQDYHKICLPTGLEADVKRIFPGVKITDNSSGCWPYEKIRRVQHSAEPRNQLQKDFIGFVLQNAKSGNKLAGILGTGTGKMEPVSRKIPTPTGYSRMGDLYIGDTVFGSRGTPIHISNVYDHGVQDVYKITFNDGRIAYCGAEHLWNVYYGTEQVTLRCIDMMKDFNTVKYKIPALQKPVEYNHTDVKDPYILARHINTTEPYIIPDEYLYNSIDVRKELLIGLFDSFGYVDITEDCTMQIKFRTMHIELLRQTRDLLLSMGMLVSNICSTYDGNIMTVNLAKPVHHLTITNIEFSHREECRCIEVDAADGLYLTEDFIVTHNTFMSCYSAIATGLRTLIVVPTSGIKKQWVETLIDMFNVDPSKVQMISSPREFFKVNKDFVVISQASLASINKNFNLEQIMKDNMFGTKIIDEVQMWFHNIIKVDANANIRNNWYLTGTFGRSSTEENDLYQRMFGDLKIFREQMKKPTIFNRRPGNIYGMKPHTNTTMIWMRSGLSPEEIKSVTSSMRYSERAGKWMRYGISVPAYTELIIPSEGNAITRYMRIALDVIEMAEKKVTYGKSLILLPTIASVERMKDLVQRMFPSKHVYSYHSRNAAAENERNKESCDILISTVSSCGTGFDMKGLSKLVLLQPMNSWIVTTQVRGRLRVRDDGKDTYMWDVVDSQIPQLRRWANNRAEILRRESKTFKVVDM